MTITVVCDDGTGTLGLACGTTTKEIGKAGTELADAYCGN